MKIDGQRKYVICNIISCILMLILGLTQSITSLDKGLFFALDLLFSIIFLLLDNKNKFFSHTKDYYMAIIEIEMLIQSTEKGIFVFILLKLQALIQILELQLLKNLTFLIVLIYSLARFKEYYYPISYVGILFLPNIIYLEKQDNSNLLQFFREVLPLSFIVIDKETQQPIYHTKTLENDYKYDPIHSKEFIECLNHFFSDNQIKLKSLFEKAQAIIYKPQQTFRIIFTEIMENCQYFAQSPIFQKISGLQISREEEDRENKFQFSNLNHNHEIIIDTPKYQQQMSKPSIQLSEETPKNKKSQIMEELLLKTESQRSICINQLKKKTLKINFTHCFWENKEAFIIILQNKEEEKFISKQITQIQDYKQQCENKDLLLATVFHDFKTPINGIVAILENLECRDDINRQGKYYLNIIRKNVNLMLYMIYDIQDYARIQKNQLRLCISDFYINEIVEEVIENFVLSAEQKEVEIVTEYDLPHYQMHSDPNRIKQILMNIISNSLKFTEKGKIIIKVLSPHSDKNDHIKRNNSSKNIRYVSAEPSISQIRKSLQGKPQFLNSKSMIYTISIEDTGCGISDSIKPQLFNLFATFPAQKIENKSGTGIGLMVCKKLVGLLGPSDEIDLWSQQGVGTKMTFRIYAKLQDDPYRLPNYIGCFKQEKSSQHISQVQNDCSIEDKEKSNQVYVRSSMLRIYTKPLDKAESETIEPSMEDADHTKSKNILLFQSLSQKITIPKLNQQEEIQDPKQKLQQILQNKKFGVLIVDDQFFNVFAFKMLLQDIVPQLKILQASNGQQAINQIVEQQKSSNIRYVFMDLQMPICNGWQAAERIRKMINNQEIENIKLVALSGFDDDAEQERCGKLGFDAFIPKPIKLEMIAEIFSQLEREF